MIAIHTLNPDALSTDAAVPSGTSYGGAPKKRRPLFEIVGDLCEAINLADGEVTDAVDAIELELADKAEAYHVIIAGKRAKAAANKDVAAKFAAVAARENAAADALMARLEKALLDSGVDKLEAQTVTATIQKSSHVELEDEAAFLLAAEDRFVRVGKDSVDKAALGRALKAGEKHDGAKMVESKYLVLR